MSLIKIKAVVKSQKRGYRCPPWGRRKGRYYKRPWRKKHSDTWDKIERRWGNQHSPSDKRNRLRKIHWNCEYCVGIEAHLKKMMDKKKVQIARRREKEWWL